MCKKVYFLENGKKNLKKAFDAYFGLTFGDFILEQTDDQEILDLSKKVKDEVSQKNGKFFEIFENIGKAGRELFELECEIKKNDKNFDPDTGAATQIKESFYDMMHDMCELMFYYGVDYGKMIESNCSI